jgi:hypothetical protein
MHKIWSISESNEHPELYTEYTQHIITLGEAKLLESKMPIEFESNYVLLEKLVGKTLEEALDLFEEDAEFSGEILADMVVILFSDVFASWDF